MKLCNDFEKLTTVLTEIGCEFSVNFGESTPVTSMRFGFSVGMTADPNVNEESWLNLGVVNLVSIASGHLAFDVETGEFLGSEDDECGNWIPRKGKEFERVYKLRRYDEDED